MNNPSSAKAEKEEYVYHQKGNILDNDFMLGSVRNCIEQKQTVNGNENDKDDDDDGGDVSRLRLSDFNIQPPAVSIQAGISRLRLK